MTDATELSKRLVRMSQVAMGRSPGLIYVWPNKATNPMREANDFTADEMLLAAEALDKMVERTTPKTFDPGAIIRRVEGTVTFDDDSQHQFSIAQDGAWQQWGAEARGLARSSDVMEDVTTAMLLAGHLRDRDEDVDDAHEAAATLSCAGCEDEENAPHAFDCTAAPNSWDEAR